MYSEYRITDDDAGHFEIDIEQNLIKNGIDINHHRQQQHVISPQNTANYNGVLHQKSASSSQHQIIYNKQASTSQYTHSNSIYTDTGQPDQDNDPLGIYHIIYM